MKTIAYAAIVEKVRELCIRANAELPKDVLLSLQAALKKEVSEHARAALEQCIQNAAIAQDEQMPICQDTGFAVYVVDMGSEVVVEGGLITDAIQEGTARGYREGNLRNSIAADPVFDRRNTGTNTPAVIHLEIVRGDSLKITLAPKGAGSENMSAVAFLKPADGDQGIIDFVARTVINAGANPCPPVIVGVGIGGTFEACALLAKKALLRPLGVAHRDERYADLEQRLCTAINASGIGAQGLGGTVTALAVHIEYFPCHIASLPVAVNINCHAARHQSVVI